MPLLRSSFVKVYFLGFNLLSTNDVFNPVFKFNLNFSRSGVIVEIRKASVSPLKVNHVVFVLVVAKVRRIVNCKFVKIFGSFFERLPKFANHGF